MDTLVELTLPARAATRGTGAEADRPDTAVTLSAETFGDRRDPAVLLIAGTASSMLAWPADLCRRLAEQGLFVVRYDQRDTGASTTFPRGEPGYGVIDLAEDAAGILAQLDIARATVIGHSLGAGVALTLAAHRPQLLAALVLMSTTTGADSLPAGAGNPAAPPDDLDARDALVAYLEADYGACDGLSPRYDAATTRRSIEAELEHTPDLATALVNHTVVQQTMPAGDVLPTVSTPTLVVHGEHDGLFPPEHGRAVAEGLPCAEFVMLPAGGHDLLEHNWDQFVAVVAAHIHTRQ